VIHDVATLPTAPRLQRASGAGRVLVRAEEGRTRIKELFQEGCAQIRFPRDAAAAGLEAVLINTAGGLTGGDRMDWRLEAGAGARLVISTPACEKVYRAAAGAAQVGVSLVAGPKSSLAWLPQETIVFDRAALSRRIDAEVAADASLLVVESVVLGREAMGETVRLASLHDRWRVRRAGRLVFADDLRLSGEIQQIAASAAVLAGARAFASLLLVAPDAETRLGPLRAALGRHGGASAFDGKLFARIAAPDGLALRRTLIVALAAMRDGQPIPRVWRV
jgi:urease accessory protein